MILFLDTSGFDYLNFSLLDEKSEKVLHKKKQRISHQQVEHSIEHLDQFLRGAKVRLNQISKIYIVSGPGSFTGIRVGFAHALAFATALNIPIYTLTKGGLPRRLSKHFIPDYGHRPNITIAKKK